MKRTNIPQTDSIQELAHFWDTHDLTDFENELEEVEEPVFERQIVIPVRLEPEEAVLSIGHRHRALLVNRFPGLVILDPVPVQLHAQPRPLRYFHAAILIHRIQLVEPAPLAVNRRLGIVDQRMH